MRRRRWYVGLAVVALAAAVVLWQAWPGLFAAGDVEDDEDGQSTDLAADIKLMWQTEPLKGQHDPSHGKDPRAGFFGYDRRLARNDLKDGAATTLMLAEAVDGGPWTAGGKATVRGLAADGRPYLGKGGQFTSLHRATNVAFADCSVRPLTAAVSPRVLEALATVAGGDGDGQGRRRGAASGFAAR